MSPVFANGAVTAAMQHLFNAECSGQMCRRNRKVDVDSVIKKALQDGRLSLDEANQIWRANGDPSLVVTVDASQLTVELQGPFVNGQAKGVVTTDWSVHGSNTVLQHSDGSYSLTPGVYDFTPNPRSWYGSWFSYAARNVETYFGFYVASHAGSREGWDYTINYRGQPNVVSP